MTILLKHPDKCPACATKHSIRWDQHRCGECNVPVYHTTDDFVALKRNWVLAFWVWFPLDSAGLFRGWVHSNHLQDGIPNDVGLTVADPGPNYGQRRVLKDGSDQRRVV
jgi:hypothetical protein